MTKKQFERWEDFAVRLATYGYPKITEARKQKLIAEVRSYFGWRNFQNDWHEIEDWDNLGDEVDEFFDEYRCWDSCKETTGKFFNQITSCIRAGFDVAVKQSGGVVGFNAGDIKRMWQGKVPTWVTKDFETPFEKISNSELVWL
jgi:hypothetical protein